ncbi:MAG: alkylation response protein AidB-like acyl-CoA dehydrogenase [Myxococcota bacterium]|jgi:alkylation response protein AidB-like acyl-CoA dehydrogenase
MPEYRAPLHDVDFLLNDVFASEAHYASLTGCEEATPDLVDAIIRGAAQFSEEVVSPLFRTGDEQGCTFKDGEVKTPDGYKEAFALYAEGGWQSLTAPAKDGGQGLPPSIGFMVSEIVGSGSWAWSMYTGLALAPVTCLLSSGTDEQKQLFLPKLLNGEWAGTMCLTEAHCGSDVGLLRTKAIKNDDGSYSLTGTKIFVSGGEQDITPNIIHSILARVEGAAPGTKGLSLFLVPKVMVKPDGSLGERNTVSCGSIEHKMGLKGSATCVMNFDGATGYLLGEESRGLEVMFELMNTARVGTAVQGLAMGQVAFQWALAYAREREQMRSLTGAKNEAGEADPIMVHPDVRRMLLTQKALVEGSRALIYWLGQLIDLAAFGDETERAESAALLELMTPIAKAFCTESSQEVTGLGLQVFGGHGYVADNGIEQLVRDGRISTVYEGTTGIQALDLVGRKVLGSGGALLRNVTALIRDFCEAEGDDPANAEFVIALSAMNDEWDELTKVVSERAIKNLDELGAASVDYAMFSGYVLLAYLWAKMALVAKRKLAAGEGDAALYEAKLTTARFYYARIAPRTRMHATAALAGAETLMTITDEGFAP